MPGHYKKKTGRKKKHVQKGGAMKKLCMCRMSKNQMGGRLLTPAQLKLLQRQHPDFRTLPVLNPMMKPKMKLKQRGKGHGCCQCGGNIFDDIGGAFKKVGKSIVSDPLRLGLGIASLGLSESFLTPAQLLRDTTGVTASKVLDKTAPIISAVGGKEAALASKLTAKALKQFGLGSRRK